MIATTLRRAALAIAASIALCSPAAAAAPGRVVLAVDGTAETRNLPLLVAERLGYFRDEGLIVTLVDSPASPSPAELVKDGRADGAVAFYHHTFMSQTDDHQVTQAVAILGVTPAEKLVVATRLREKVKTPADLKGLKIYTGGANSGKTTSFNWLAARAGFGIGGYTALAPVSREKMARALADGEADAIVSHEPDASVYVASGVGFVLADLSSPAATKQTLGALYPSTSLYLPKAYVTAHPETVQHLVNACLRALAYINGHDAAGVAAILPKRAGGKEAGAEWLHTLAEDKQMFDTDGLMPAAGAREELKAMTALSAKYAAVDFDLTFTDQFVEAWRHARSADARP